ncbi:hypothetical protein J6T93_02095 [bacterium]|nr:hypothetical protein [bacterium]
MRSGLLSVFIFCLAAAAFSADTVIFGGMRLTYSGKGYCVASPYSNGGKWDVWDLKVVDNAALAAKATLTIRPLENDPTNFCVKIRSLSAPALRSLKITFPPGGNGVGYLKDLYVDSAMQSITILGGDLGSNEAGDGLVSIKGSVEQLKISGLKHKDKATGELTYWGGDLWADVSIKGNLGSCLITGGNYSFLPGLKEQRLACFNVSGTVKKFALKSYLMKDDKGLAYLKGGFASADLAAASSIDNLTITGGGWQNGLVKAQRIGKVSVSGPNPQAAFLPAPKEDYGLLNASLRTMSDANPDNFTNYYMGAVSLRSVNARDSLISSHGSLKSLKASADKSGEGGTIFNTFVYAGVGYENNYISSPVIFASAPNSGILQAGTNCVFTLPFSVTNLPSEGVSSISIASRGLAWGCFISNTVNETFSGFDMYDVSGENAVSGTFVWDPALGDFDFSGTEYYTLTNIKIRVSYGASPRRHTELPLTIRVRQNKKEVTSTNFIHSASSAAPQRKVYPGNISAVNCCEASNSLFAGGLLLSSDGTSEHATYMGSLNSFKASGSAKGNLLYSKKNIKLDKYFDYENNEVWIGGARKK